VNERIDIINQRSILSLMFYSQWTCNKKSNKPGNVVVVVAVALAFITAARF